jgi:hypothetical protein
MLLEWPMRAALRGIQVPPWVFVHGVDRVPPGVCRWPDRDQPARRGDLGDQLVRVCLDQGLAGPDDRG